MYFINTNIYADEKFVGFVDSLQGDVFIIKSEETVKLNEFDQIFINDKIKIKKTRLLLFF